MPTTIRDPAGYQRRLGDHEAAMRSGGGSLYRQTAAAGRVSAEPGRRRTSLLSAPTARGHRKDEITIRFAAFLATGFAERNPVFDDACAKGYATARPLRERDGRPVQIQDALIGGMALAYGATLTTRNISDFQGHGLSLIDPWRSDP
jgi:predicted nucleic acid-binding protein